MGWCSLLKSNPSLQHLHQSLILYIEVAQGFYLPGWNVQFTYTCTLTSHFTSLSSVMLLAYISTYFLLSKWTVTLFFKNFSSVLTCHLFRLLHAYILCHHLLVSAVSLLSCPLKRFLFCTSPFEPWYKLLYVFLSTFSTCALANLSICSRQTLNTHLQGGLSSF